MSGTAVLVGLSHRRAPVEVRERVALTADQASEIARGLAGDGEEAVCLSTCNRTEIYGVFASADAGERRALESMVAASGMDAAELGGLVYRLRGEDVARHLFRVAGGLDSLVPGEGEILGQVRAAFEQGSPGVMLDRMFRGAIHAGRKVRGQTAIGEVPASVAAAAAALAEQLFGDLSSSRVMLVGAGKTGGLAARSLTARGARIAFVANRSLAKAEQVAATFAAAPVELEDLSGHLADADVVVCSTSSREYVLTRSEVEPCLRARRGRPLFLIDIAVPRDVDPSIHDLDGCFVYDIDDLESVVADSAPDRQHEADRAEAIVAEEAAQFHAWLASRDVAPAITLLRARAEEIRLGELARVRGRLSAAELATVESVSARIVDKLLHAPTVRLKEAAAAADGTTAAGVLRDLFDLDDRAAPGRDAR